MSTTFRILARSLGESRRLGGSSDVGIIIAIAGTLCCKNPFDCNRDFDTYGGIVVWLLVMVYMFKALGVICDEYFVPALEVICEKLQLSNDVAGATFMAAGSSAPEFFTSTVATFLIVNEGGVGTIVGSAIFNILVICGATGLVACKTKALKIWWYPLTRDSFFYLLSIGEMVLFVHDEEIKWYEGLSMFFTYLLYCLYMKLNPTIIKMLGIYNPEEDDDVATIDEAEIHVVEPAEVRDMGGELRINGTGSITTAGTEQTELRKLATGEAVKEDVGQLNLTAQVLNTPGTVNDDAKEEVDCDPFKSEKSINSNFGESEPKVAKIDIMNSEINARGSMQSHLEPNDLQKSPRERRRISWGYAETARKSSKEGYAHPPMIRRPSKEARRHSKGDAKDQEQNSKDSSHEGDDTKAEDTTQEEDGKEEDEPLTGWRRFARDPLLVFWELVMPDAETGHGMPLFFASIFFIGLCTFLMVDAVNRTGQILNIPTLAMALVFLAAGTSIPDMLGSIAVAKQGEGDMAIANALGSNVFDILVGLGVPWFIKTGLLQERVTFEGKWKELVWDIGALVGVLVLFVGCIAINKWYLNRTIGAVLLALYLVFLLWQVFCVWVFDPPLKENLEDCTY